jgi:predicted metal-dependent hydrolase
MRRNGRDVLMLLGMALRMLPDYLAFYRADFHPDQHPQHELLDQWRHTLQLS